MSGEDPSFPVPEDEQPALFPEGFSPAEELAVLRAEIRLGRQGTP